MTRPVFPVFIAATLLGGLGFTAEAPAQAAPREGGNPEVIDEADQVRRALELQEADAEAEESEYVEQVLSAERNYSLVRRGQLDVLYSFNYDYASTDRLDIQYDAENFRFTRFDVERDAEHAVRNTLTVDYGLLDNINVGVVLPIVTKYSTRNNRSLHQTDLGDIGLRARWQPRPVRPGRTTITLFTDATLPTGHSPYEIDVDDELSTGSGFYSVGAGASFSRVVDPVVAFGSLSAGHSFDADGLHQVRGSRILREVRPGNSFSFSLGMAYALSYDVSMTLQYQQTFNARTRFVFDDGTAESEFQTAGLFSVSTGWRLSGRTIMNVTLGVGQTGESPDIVLAVNLPLTYGGLR